MRQIQIQLKDLIPISITLVAVIIFGLLVSNQWMIFSTVQKELIDEKANMESLSLKKDFLIKLKDNENKLIKEFQSLDYMMPSDKEYTKIFDYLQSVFIEYNLHVIQIQFDDLVEKESYMEIPIKISLNGQYSQIVEFLSDFRIGDRPFRVDEFYMDREDITDSLIHCDLLSFAFFKTSTD